MSFRRAGMVQVMDGTASGLKRKRFRAPNARLTTGGPSKNALKLINDFAGNHKIDALRQRWLIDLIDNLEKRFSLQVAQAQQAQAEAEEKLRESLAAGLLRDIQVTELQEKIAAAEERCKTAEVGLLTAQGEMLDLQAALGRTEEHAYQAQADCTLLKQAVRGVTSGETKARQVLAARAHDMRQGWLDARRQLRAHRRMVSEQEAQLGFMQREVTRAQTSHDTDIGGVWAHVNTSKPTHHPDTAKVDAASLAAPCNLLATQAQAVGASSPQRKIRKSPAKAAGGATAVQSHAAQLDSYQQPQSSHQHPSNFGCHEAGDATPKITKDSPAAQARAGHPAGVGTLRSNDTAVVSDAVGSSMPEHVSSREVPQSAPSSRARSEGGQAHGTNTINSPAVAAETLDTAAVTCPDRRDVQAAVGNGSKDTQAPMQDVKQRLDILTWLPLVPTASIGLAAQAEKSGSTNVHFNLVHRPCLVPDGRVLCA